MLEIVANLVPIKTAMESLGWSVRQEGGQLIAYCCGHQVAATMPARAEADQPLELHCSECGARVMPASWTGINLSQREKQQAVESGRYWVAVAPGPHETVLRLKGCDYRMVTIRNPTEGRWCGRLWRDGTEIFQCVDEIRLGRDAVNGLSQVRRNLCMRAHHDAGEQHDCDDRCWRPMT